MIPKSTRCLEDVTLNRCHFPTSKREVEYSYSHERIGVFTAHENCYDIGIDPQDLQDVLQIAWVILLHNYIRDDTISFVLYFERQHSDQPLERANSCIPRLGAEAMLLHYDVSKKCRLKDVRASTCWEIDSQDMVETQVNTAIHISTCLGLRTGHGNACTKPSNTCQCHRKVNPVS